MEIVLWFRTNIWPFYNLILSIWFFLNKPNICKLNRSWFPLTISEWNYQFWFTVCKRKKQNNFTIKNTFEFIHCSWFTCFDQSSTTFFSVLSLSLPLIEISWREKMNKNTKKSYCRFLSIILFTTGRSYFSASSWV